MCPICPTVVFIIVVGLVVVDSLLIGVVGLVFVRDRVCCCSGVVAPLLICVGSDIAGKCSLLHGEVPFLTSANCGLPYQLNIFILRGILTTFLTFFFCFGWLYNTNSLISIASY